MLLESDLETSKTDLDNQAVTAISQHLLCSLSDRTAVSGHGGGKVAGGGGVC